MRITLAAVAAFFMLAVGGQAAVQADPTIAPGQSWQTVYNAAPAGSTIHVLAGVHPPQKIVGTKPVTFLGEPGNEVRQIQEFIPGVVFDGIVINGNAQKWSVSPGISALFETDEPGVFKNGSIGNTRDQKGALIYGAGWTFDNVRFHDAVIYSSGVHLECIQAYAVPNFTLRNSTFTNCGIMGLSLGYPGWWSPKPPAYAGVVIEGNTFNAPNPSNNYALAIWQNKDSCNDTCGFGVMTNYRIRNNYIWSLINRMSTDSSTVICGNTGPGAPAAWQTACSQPPPPPPPPAACGDSLDNDGDGLVDLNDPGCSDADDTDEFNVPPPPPPAPSCDAACEQAYRDQIAALTAERDAALAAKQSAEGARDQAVQERDAARAKLDQIHSLSAP